MRNRIITGGLIGKRNGWVCESWRATRPRDKNARAHPVWWEESRKGVGRPTTDTPHDSERPVHRLGRSPKELALICRAHVDKDRGRASSEHRYCVPRADFQLMSYVRQIASLPDGPSNADGCRTRGAYRSYRLGAKFQPPLPAEPPIRGAMWPVRPAMAASFRAYRFIGVPFRGGVVVHRIRGQALRKSGAFVHRAHGQDAVAGAAGRERRRMKGPPPMTASSIWRSPLKPTRYSRLKTSARLSHFGRRSKSRTAGAHRVTCYSGREGDQKMKRARADTRARKMSFDQSSSGAGIWLVAFPHVERSWRSRDVCCTVR